jgi:hypothetical protein
MADGLHIHIQNRTKKPLAIALSQGGRGPRRGAGGGDQPMYNISLFRIVTMNPPCTLY